jgi:hypothetical protein
MVRLSTKPFHRHVMKYTIGSVMQYTNGSVMLYTKCLVLHYAILPLVLPQNILDKKYIYIKLPCELSSISETVYLLPPPPHFKPSSWIMFLTHPRPPTVSSLFPGAYSCQARGKHLQVVSSTLQDIEVWNRRTQTTRDLTRTSSSSTEKRQHLIRD